MAQYCIMRSAPSATLPRPPGKHCVITMSAAFTLIQYKFNLFLLDHVSRLRCYFCLSNLHFKYESKVKTSSLAYNRRETSLAVRQMPGDLCTAPSIISLSTLLLATDVTDATLGESGLCLGTRTGAGGTVKLA